MSSEYVAERPPSDADEFITPSHTALADREEGRSLSPEAQTSERAFHSPRGGALAPLSSGTEVSRALLFRDSRRKVCDVCLSKDNVKNRVLEYIGIDAVEFSSLTILFERRVGGQIRNVEFKPFEEEKKRAETDTARSRSVRTCRRCLRQLKIVCFPTKRQRKQVAKIEMYIWNRLSANKRKQDEPEQDDTLTITSKKCYLHGQTTFVTSSAAPTKDLSCPLYLQSRISERWKIDKWISEFSKEMGIGTSVSEEIVKNADTIRLCQRHCGAMRNTMMVIEASAACCSVCGNTGDKRYAGDVTKFPYEELREHPDIVGVVEDSLRVLIENKMQPRDVKNICSPSRLVILGRVSMRSQGLSLKIHETKGFDYEPTPSIVLRCIQYIRTQLREKKRIFVKLKEVHDHYLELVIDQRFTPSSATCA